MTATGHEPQIVLPDAESLRTRIEALDEEAALLRKLLRLVMRIEMRQPHTVGIAERLNRKVVVDAER
jgi:hypothetical protein